MSQGKRIRWTIAKARESLPALITMAAREPQDVYRRDRLVARVVSPELVPDAGRRPIAEALAELQRICAEDEYELPTIKRTTRANPLAPRKPSRRRRTK